MCLDLFAETVNEPTPLPGKAAWPRAWERSRDGQSKPGPPGVSEAPGMQLIMVVLLSYLQGSGKVTPLLALLKGGRGSRAVVLR